MLSAVHHVVHTQNDTDEEMENNAIDAVYVRTHLSDRKKILPMEISKHSHVSFLGK